MNKASDSRSGLPLLLIYTLLVVAGMVIAGSVSFSLASVAARYGDALLIVLVMLSLVGSWPLATWLEEKLSVRIARLATAPVKAMRPPG